MLSIETSIGHRNLEVGLDRDLLKQQRAINIVLLSVEWPIEEAKKFLSELWWKFEEVNRTDPG
jgi:hypothetical protein